MTKMKDLEREFEQLVREHRGTIYTVCYMFSNDQDEVADLFQEVLINLWNSLPSFKGRSDVRSWIYRVSLNVCISIDRKKRRITKLGQFDRAIILLWLENISYEEIAAIMGISIKNVSVRLYRIKEELKNMSNE